MVVQNTGTIVHKLTLPGLIYTAIYYHEFGKWIDALVKARRGDYADKSLAQLTHLSLLRHSTSVLVVCEGPR
ncbi:hypothetical protein RSAG8_07782, partial [Rhizoctonia solani AG-8 WAC10335]